MNNRTFNGTEVQKSNYFVSSSTVQEAGTESETPIPTAEVGPHVATTSSACNFNPSDLGTIQSPSSLSDEQKYQFSQPFLLSSKSIQSIVKNGVINHTGLGSFLGFSTLYHWMVSSMVHAFCLVNNSEFFFSPLHNWKNAVGTSHGILNRHSLSQTHRQCMKQAVSFIAVMEKNKLSIKSQLSEAYDKQVQLNTRALVLIIDSNWDKGSKREDGNFTSLLDFLSKYSANLKSHLQDICHLRSKMNSSESMVTLLDSL